MLNLGRPKAQDKIIPLIAQALSEPPIIWHTPTRLQFVLKEKFQAEFSLPTIRKYLKMLLLAEKIEAEVFTKSKNNKYFTVYKIKV